VKDCRHCGSQVAEGEDVCAECRKVLISAFGPQGCAGGPAPMPAQILRLRVEQTHAQKKRNSRGILRLAVVCAGTVVSVLAVLGLLYHAAVLSYAELETVVIQQSPDDPSSISWSFKIRTPGKVRYVRRSGRHHSEKVDRFLTRAEARMTWRTERTDLASGLEFTVRHRRGYLPVEVQKRFVTRPSDTPATGKT